MTFPSSKVTPFAAILPDDFKLMFVPTAKKKMNNITEVPIMNEPVTPVNVTSAFGQIE
ncbi:hypothetical protein FD47_GL001988 [Lentilactobacillus parafarraginis DSM 18390 = JCM 14109]|uniref:Uncharacterized protein n=1 Tax=Lentilactobacillus parafarraginis DSM 18390 = JCM 14109 TaxID=1423786 RepID=A0A0R1YQ90_9LACO|nr:hypothetical protein FD47_GL001988 [Lentilactobacillus parafarraginis DSM 18390 = JCM 14109]